jgi:starvation-inducible DNA-binding protein
MEPIRTGIEKAAREKAAHELSSLLSDTALLALKTQNYHWNILGQPFEALHLRFEQQYRGLFESLDEIAERIRALGWRAPGSFRTFLHLTQLQEDDILPSTPIEMVRHLVRDHESITQSCRSLCIELQKIDDFVTCDLLTRRMAAHEKMSWMLRSFLETEPTELRIPLERITKTEIEAKTPKPGSAA